MARVQLVSVVAEGPGLQRDRWYAPLGLVWVGSYLRAHGHSVEILDGQILCDDEIVSRLDGDIVGIGYFINSTHIADRVAAAAKAQGRTVVYGGQSATPVAQQILRNNTNVDCVIRFDGERAMELLARRAEGEAISLEAIPNLAYRDGDLIRLTECEELDLSTLPFPDRRLPGLDLEAHIRNFLERGSEEKFGCLRPTNAYTRKGCPRRGPGYGCSFCARIDMSVRSKTAKQAYDEYRYLVDEFSVDYICDDSDTWIRKEWLQDILDLMERHGEIGARFRVYGDVRDITEHTAPLLREVGVDAVLVGMESGDEGTLRINGKPMRNERMLKAADLLGKNGVKICDAYVLGLMGETEETLLQTRAFAEKVHSLCEAQITYWNLILPLPGSPIWDQMMLREPFAAKYGDAYRFEVEELRRDYVDAFCRLGPNGYDRLLQIREELFVRDCVAAGEYLR
ncbi:MAG: cobalamin B12-binding domain-containing protein [Planctomycetes bacterium]|nr:cobalamin B12-binding domain-containing protein [Planctomycetota bacterium]